jgi:hypothetical protein
MGSSAGKPIVVGVDGSRESDGHWIGPSRRPGDVVAVSRLGREPAGSDRPPTSRRKPETQRASPDQSAVVMQNGRPSGSAMTTYAPSPG